MVYDDNKKDMVLYSWGSNSHGQLGQGTEVEQRELPTRVNIDLEVNSLTGGGKHTILVTSNNEIFLCGDNDKGQLGKQTKIKSLNVFQPLLFPLKVTKVSCGWDFNLLLTEDYEVWGWGSNSFGQLGFPRETVSFVTTPNKIFYKKAIDIGAGLRHSAVVGRDGLVYTCGFGKKGQLGVLINDKVPTVSEKFIQVDNIKNCKEVSCGECHTVAKTANGDFYSWGNNRYGQLGIDNKITFSNSPIKIDMPVNRTSHFSSGWAHNAILTAEGQLITWGRNDFGQLGEDREFPWKPQVVKSLEKIKQVSLGSHHCIALTEGGEVLTWGWNEHGNCGNDSCENVKRPCKLKHVKGVKLIGSGAAQGFFTCQMNGRGGDVLEVRNSNSKPTECEMLKEIPTVDTSLCYSDFFETFLLANKPCIIDRVTHNWPCRGKWIRGASLDTEHFRSKYKNIQVPISNCGKREYNVQKKCSMALHDYLSYWEEYREASGLKDCLYLKDWHFMKEFPEEPVYRVPPYFASDWLNEYYDNNPELNDDYRFVYIGPKGSWTPFHADVFTSFSWSVNVSGRKKWILVPPGKEIHLRDNLGNLNYDIDLSKLNRYGNEKEFQSFEVIQEEGQGLFVPSGWHHQVWNLEDTISINHNWINGCNVHHVWESLKRSLSDVMKEISDCRDMENWMSQCQLVLSASFGFDYRFFHSFLVETAKSRIEALKAHKNISVYGNWDLGENHMKFDLRRILEILTLLEKDESFIEFAEIENILNHALEFLDSLKSFCDETY